MSQQFGKRDFETELLSRTRGGCLAELLPMRRGSDKTDKGLGNLRDLAPHYQDARTSVIEELRYRTNRSSDNRFSRRHCFQKHDAEAFLNTG